MLLIIFASSTFILIALFVLFMSSANLASLTGIVISLQQLSFIFTFASALLPPEVASISAYMAIFNFEIGVVKPG